MEMFVESQMFEVFVQERAKTQRLNTGRFEQRVTMYMQSLPLVRAAHALFFLKANT
jgi:hypothetical protein